MFRVRTLLIGVVTCVAVAGAALPAVSQAAVAPHAAKYVYGIDTYVTYDCVSASVIDSWATTEAEQFKKLGANSVGIGFPLYTPSITSNTVTATYQCGNQNYQSPPASILGGIVKAYEKVGLKVLLRPLIDNTNLYEQNPNDWRGILQPTNISAWMQSYLKTLQPYLQMAQQDKVTYFALQTELDSLSHEPNWKSALTISKILYKGEFVWDYSWLSAVNKVTLPGTKFAIDAYPKLPTLSTSASTTQIEAAWTALLKTKGYHLPSVRATTIDEVGIAAQDGAYANPSNTGLSLTRYPFDQKIQANWFTAACSFMKKNHLPGIYFWGPFLTKDDGNMLKSPDPDVSSDIQPLSQTAIKKCF